MTVYYSDEQVTLHLGDALEVLRTLPDASVDCCVTSPPYYGLRDYGMDGQYGLESSVGEYVETMRLVFAEVRRVLAADGTLWLNLGDSYVSPGGQTDRTATTRLSGHPSVRLNGRPPRQSGELPPKNLLGVPWRVAFALQDDGWILRNDIIWHKPNGMPESVIDRLSGRHEHIFMLAKSTQYFFGLDAIRESSGYEGRTWEQRKSLGEPMKHGLAGAAAVGARDFAPHANGRNPGSVWSIPTTPYPQAHFAVMTREVARRCIKAGCKPGGTVLDPFSGSGTTGEAARMLGRRYIGVDLNSAYHDLAIKRFAQGVLDFEEAS